jgi:hypothetical protein
MAVFVTKNAQAINWVILGLYCDDMITPNQRDELTLFLECEDFPSRFPSLLF